MKSKALDEERRRLVEQLDKFALLSRTGTIFMLDGEGMELGLFFRGCCGKYAVAKCCHRQTGLRPVSRHLRRPENRRWCAVWRPFMTSSPARPVNALLWEDFDFIWKLRLEPEEPYGPFEVIAHALDGESS